MSAWCNYEGFRFSFTFSLQSTALQALWWQLGSLLDRKPELLDEPLDEMEALCDARLKQRIRNFLTSNRILVFVMDLSTGGGHYFLSAGI